MARQSVDRGMLLHLLTENELTMPEIGKRAGCSRERVRQPAQELLGTTGWQRERARPDRRLEASFDKNLFVQAARRRGFKPSKREQPYDWYTRKLYVEGKLCLLRCATESVGYRRWYVRLRKQREKAEINLMELANGDFLINPTSQMPTLPTIFLACMIRRRRKKYELPRHWRKYLNNWSVFRRQGGNAAQTRWAKHKKMKM